MAKINKIKVSNGIYWVEIPAVKLRILCGCPPDSVKHMMKRGLIVSTEKKGVSFETGPNAILLSDVLLQNGTIANMAEFPVLQMLYRQGMIIPGHPNNFGKKPILIGLKEQVTAQMQYIYRGNYGLISEDELVSAGATPDDAREMMNMKLKFAFGKISPSTEFLDTRVIENEAVEIRDGVNISRIHLNIFEISYQGQSVMVDLNLNEGEHFQSPFPLGNYQIKREYFSVIHAGDGDGWDINRPSMSSIVLFHGKIYLIDAGPNVTENLTALGIGINEIEGIFHTHCHDDHFAGLTSLIRADKRISYFATSLVRASVTKKLTALLSIDETEFSKYFNVKELAPGEWNDIEGLEVKPVFSPHPVETTLFVFRTLWEGGYRSYAHFADIVGLDTLEKMIRPDESLPGINRKTFDRVKNDYMLPANVKKLDIGGGMIHGAAEDFKEDGSPKIVLSHTSLPLTDRQKEIGSGAPFGTVDSLIPSYKDFVWRLAYHFLRDYFPSAPENHLQILLNNEIVSFNPESIIYKEGDIPKDMYLILTGNVEVIRTKEGAKGLLYSGALIGETPGLYKIPCRQTYRAKSFVQGLLIPGSLYIEFVKMNRLGETIEKFRSIRDFLRKTYLFGEGISYIVQNRLANSAKLLSHAKGEEVIVNESSSLYLVFKGNYERFLGPDTYENIGQGAFFGEEMALFKTSPLFRLRATENSEVYEIPGEILEEIPIARWKLFEAFERRKRLLLNTDTSSLSIFDWREEYSVNNSEMDSQHKELILLGSEICDTIQNGGKLKDQVAKLDKLIKSSELHFKTEEEFLHKISFPDYEVHRERHCELLEEAYRMKELFASSEFERCIDFVEFFKKWIIDHILSDDRVYKAFMEKEEG